MSKNINVNPGQYKVAGRERPGEDINPAAERMKLKNQERARPARAQRKKATRKA